MEKVLSKPNYKIDGFSLYEVGGGWRGPITLSTAGQKEWKQLKSLRRRFQSNDFKDLIKPLYEKNGNKFAVFDETSIVLRIIVDAETNLTRLEDAESKAIREIKEIIKEITAHERSIYFTIKKLDFKGLIKRKK